MPVILEMGSSGVIPALEKWSGLWGVDSQLDANGGGHQLAFN